MKLYRTTARNQSGWQMFKSNVTRFSTSETKARALAKGYDIAQVTRVTLPDRITAQDWIDLLESDSPGNQSVNRTPVDFILKSEIIWRKGDQTESGS